VTPEAPPFDQIGIVVGLASEAKLARKLTANVLCCGGRPEVASRQALELVNNGVTTLMSFGIAGALSPTLRPGSRVIATEVVTDFDSYPAIASSAKLLKGHSGPIYGGWEIVATPEDKAALYAKTGALAVDMESAAVAKVAMDRGVPFVALRVVADPAGSGLPPAALLPLTATGRPRLLAVFWSVLTNPGQIPALIRTANQTRAAMKSLRRAVRRLAKAY
jgi:hopanoid-associated phosphorylase